ncbi:hypothetical protein AX16_005432 [Volvariella volvacea WC 439]|nr:hypothetical protein AX16_005432 [Volvariella volvacea WC 439]
MNSRVKPLYYTKGSVFWGSYPSPPEIAYVKSLVVERGARPTTLQEYLPNCYNLEELTVLDRGVLSQDTLPLIESLLQSPLRRTSWSSLHTLKASLRVLFQGHFIQDEGGNTHIDFTHPVIKNLRRLGLLYDKEWSNPSSWVDGNNFGCLSSLRYLRFDEAVCFEVIINILRECNSLELVVFEVNTGGWYERLPRTKK